MREVTYDNQGGVISDVGTPNNRKSIYTQQDVINRITRTIRQEIQAEKEAGDAYATDFIFLVSTLPVFDLNDPPEGFVDDLDGMAANVNISLTQQQVDNFLER